MHAICCFEDQEVNNPILQMMHNSELKWRSYSHCKLIAPSWRKNFAQRCEITFLLWDDFAAFLYSVVFPSWSFPSRWKLNTTSWKTTSQHCEISRLLWSDFAALFVSLQNLAGPFALAKWSLVLPDICYRHWEIFFIRFLLSKSQNSPCKPPIISFLSF